MAPINHATLLAIDSVTHPLVVLVTVMEAITSYLTCIESFPPDAAKKNLFVTSATSVDCLLIFIQELEEVMTPTY